MGTVLVYDADRMKQIEDASVVEGYVTPNQRLILKTRDGNEMDAGDISATARLQVADTDTVDMKLQGLGTPASPWVISADVKDASIQLITTLLDPNYKGFGAARAYASGELSTEAFPWNTPYQPNGSRLVRLQRKGTNSFYILGQVSDEYRDITLASGWSPHFDPNANTTFNLRIRANRLISGLVVLAGLIQYTGGTPAAGTLIGTLPEDCRPSVSLMLPVITGDLPRAIMVHPDGRVETRGSWPANAYLALDGVAFFAANTVQWTPIGEGGSAWGPNFQPVTSNPAYGVPSFYKDFYGFVWLQGMIQLKAAVSTDNTVIFTLPAGHGASAQQHYRAVGADQYASVGVASTNFLWKTGTAASALGSWISLSGLSIATDDALAQNSWYTPSNIINGWAQYPGSFSVLGYLRREDGLAISKGFIRSGTLGSRMSVMPEELWPSGGRLILATSSGAASGRLEIAGSREILQDVMPGAVIPRSGATSWYSLDGMKWVP